MEPTPTPTPVPNSLPLPADAQFTQITAGWHHACGLQDDGTADCWGRNISGSLELPGGNPTFSRISAGLNFNCGLRPDGAIACWGENEAGQASPPNGRFYDIAAGQNHACALSEGALTCWGKGFPDGPQTIQEIPKFLSTIQAGAGFTCGLTSDADMACWTNVDEKLADKFGDDGSGLAITPGPFAGLAIGLRHACAISADGGVFCRAEDRKHYSLRAAFPPSTKFVQAAGGMYHACGITELSDIECWGSGAPGAAGQRLSAPEGKFTAVSIASRHSCALTLPDGYATCWHQPDIGTPLYPLHEAFAGVKFEWPVALFSLPDGRLAVVERKGTIVAYSDEPNAAPPKMMLDISDNTICCDGESGIFSAALDPQFEEFPFLYVYRDIPSEPAHGESKLVSVGRLARFRVENGQAVRDSELTILDLPHRFKYHYGGEISFGADGMLYLGIGDNAYLAHKAQALSSLRGKIIRIDVRGATPEQPYRIPPDNPFVNNPDALPEIWAYGLRNPWRMDFAPDGRLFIADVGEEEQEEVSLAAAGDNLGWPICESALCRVNVEADAAGLTAPLFVYGKEDGCAIIGGVTAPRLNNGFIFGDYCSHRIWLLEQDERESWRMRLIAQAERPILSFGMDADGTVYVLSRQSPIMRLQIDGED